VEDAIPDLPMETQGIYAVYPPGRFTQPKVRAFIDFLVHSFGDKGPSDWKGRPPDFPRGLSATGPG
jgi:hypothetical protein